MYRYRSLSYRSRSSSYIYMRIGHQADRYNTPITVQRDKVSGYIMASKQVK